MNRPIQPHPGPPDPAAAVVLFAHGSRDPLWRAPIDAVAARMAQIDPQRPVRCAFLELCSPDLPTCVDQLVDEGQRAIQVLPLFLGVGRHAREDLPRIVEALVRRHPGVQFTLRRAVGEEPSLIDLMARLALG